MTRTLKAALLGCVLTSPAWADQMVKIPPMPALHGARQVAAMVLQNPHSSAILDHYVTTGIVFPAGSVPSGSGLRATIGGRGPKIPVQMDERTHWGDGSVRMAALSFRQPSLAAGVKSPMVIELSNKPQDRPLNLAAFTPGVATVDLSLGGHDYHLDVAKLLDNGKPNYWLRGPVATEARVDAPITGALHVTIDVRLYASGSAMLDVTYANDLAYAHGGPVSYTATTKIGAVRSKPVTIKSQQPFTDWHQVLWSRGAPTVNVVHDVATLERLGSVPRYPLAQGVAQSVLNGQVAANSCAPLSPCGFTPYMPETGGREDIGVVPLWDVYWLQTQAPQAARYALAQADAAGAVPWHAEQSAGVPVMVTQNPTFWADDRCAGNGGKQCSPMSFSAASAGSGNGVAITPDTAHQPELAYVAYLLTGQRHYLDELAAQAGFAITSAWPGGIRNPISSSLVIGPNQQLRAGAWSLRELLYASLAEPDGSALKAYFASGVQTNLIWIAADAALPKKGQLAGWIDCGEGHLAPWQNDFLALVLQQAVHAQVANAAVALGAMTPFLVNRFLQPPNVFSPFNATAYYLIVGPSGSQDYTTWAQVQQATVADGLSNTTAPIGPAPGVWALDYGVAATSVVRALPATSAQQQAMAWINANPAASPSQANPAWVIDP